jgi:hypothetical protein
VTASRTLNNRKDERQDDDSDTKCEAAFHIQFTKLTTSDGLEVWEGEDGAARSSQSAHHMKQLQQEGNNRVQCPTQDCGRSDTSTDILSTNDS